MFMFLRYKGCNEQDAAQIAAHTDGLTGLYDMVFTSYEKNYVIHHMTICGNTLCGYRPIRSSQNRLFINTFRIS